MRSILTIDDKIIHFVNDHMRCRSVDKVMRIVSRIGDNGAIWIGTSFCLIFMGGKSRKAGLLMLGSLGAEASICNLAIKPSVARIRPYDAHGLMITIKQPKDYSFPSGHTAAAFAAAFSMYMSDRKHGILMLYGAALMGFSRIYLLVHYPLDVIAGAALGVASAFTVNKLNSHGELGEKEREKA
ncbi:undecaprenyl-diphosphatase BcrC [Clostridiales bacterium]|nr:undecaprenyl-diphosphatase BcrC [Clostridiales bacterium]